VIEKIGLDEINIYLIMKFIKSWSLLETEQITTQEYNKLKWSGQCRLEMFNIAEINAIKKALSGFNFTQEKDEEEDQLKFWHEYIHIFFSIDKVSQAGKVFYLVYYSKLFDQQVIRFDEYFFMLRFLSKNNL
jgi:hypothetical protein